jgi:hypothetical protein
MLASNDAAAKVATAAVISKPAPTYTPATVSTPADASARLEQLKNDPAWRDDFLAGRAEHKAEFRSLTKMIASGDDFDKAIAGVLYDGIQPSGHLANVGTAEMLRSLGADDGVIRQVLAGQPVSKEERASAAATKDRLLKDSTFVDKYTAGNEEARRQVTLLNVILSSPIKQSAA